MLLLEDRPQQCGSDVRAHELSTFKAYMSVMSLVRQKPGFRLRCPRPLHPNFKGEDVSCSSVDTKYQGSSGGQ